MTSLKCHQTPGPNTIKIGDTELSLKDKKLAMEKITPLQYMEGSLKILCEMITKDRVNTETILDHIGFLTKMACMGQTSPGPPSVFPHPPTLLFAFNHFNALYGDISYSILFYHVPPSQIVSVLLLYV